MPSATRGKYSAKEVRLNPSLLNKTSSTKSSSSSGAPKAPKTGDFKFDSSKLVPTYTAEAASIYNPQIQQIQGLQALTKAQSEDAKVKTKDEFAQLLKREQENINRRGAFFSGGAIDQENRIGAQEGGALRDIGFQEQSANLQYQGTLSEIAQAQKDYVSSKVEGAYSSAYKTFQDKIANQMNQYQMELGQYNQDRQFQQSKLESDRNYALSAAASARAGASQGNAESNLKSQLTEQVYSGAISREAAKQIYAQKYPGSDPNWIYNAASDGYEKNIISAAKKDGVNLSSTQVSALADMDATINLAKKVKLQAQGVSTGPVAGRVGQAAQTVGGASDDFVNLNANISQIKANFMKAISGAAVSEQEAQRLAAFLPSVNDQENVIQIKLQNLEENLQATRDSLYKSAGGANPYNVSSTQMIPVYDLNSGQAGMIPENEFDPMQYQRR